MNMHLEYVAELYAKALFNAVATADDADVLENVQTWTEAFLEQHLHSENLRKILDETLCPRKVKLEFLISLEAPRFINNMLFVLYDNSRMSLLVIILKRFLQIVKLSKGEMEAVVFSVVPLSKNAHQSISKALKLYFQKKKVLLTNLINKDILGGVVVRVGYLVFDFSVLKKIEDFDRASKEALRVF